MEGLNPLLTVLDTNRLTGPNFKDWLRNLRIVLSYERIDYVLDNPPMKKIQEDANEEEKKAYTNWSNDNNTARCYMLAYMNNELQKKHFGIDSAYDILQDIEKAWADVRGMRYKISTKLFRMRMSDGSSVRDHAQKMVSYIEQLEELGANMSNDLAVDLILQSLPKSFSQFITNYTMKKEDYKLSELVSMLTSAESSSMVESSTSSTATKAKPEVKPQIMKVKVKPKIVIKKAELKPKGGIKKPRVKPKVGVKKAQVLLEGSIKKDSLNSSIIDLAAINPDEWHMWKKPEVGWIKLNTDGCTKGYGGLFRDHDGQPLFGYVKKVSTDDTYSTELWAVLRGIELAITYGNGIRCLWVESDSMAVVNSINKDWPFPATSAIYLNQIWQWIERFEKFQISYSWRECNRAADHLSKMDYIRENIDFTEAVLNPADFPERLSTIIKEDAEGRLYKRKKHSSTCQSQANIVPTLSDVLALKVG